MSQVIIFANAFGGVSVCAPTGEISIEEVKNNNTPEESIIVDSDTLPHEFDDFFDAWELFDGVVSINLAKAREITKIRLRALRAPLLAAQDIAFQRALEDGLDTTAIVAEKRRLRDITKLADHANSLNELRAIVDNWIRRT